MNNYITFIISLGVLLMFSIVDVISHRKFKKYPNLVFHVIGIGAILTSLGLLAVHEFIFTFMIYPGIILILGSLIIIILSYIQIRKHFLTARGIVKMGLYKYTRHPMYLGIVLFFIGLVIAVPSIYVFVYSITAILLIIWQAYEEEKYLKRRFPQYKKYSKKTGMFFPR
jgi:protein-S-isoprenylcysteine O-methyltransferase Ste14